MTQPSRHEPIFAVDETPDWCAALTRIASAPLEFCPQFPAIARRFEAWWDHEIVDRPIFVATANSNPGRPITRRLELLSNPDAWFDAKFADMIQLHYVGDALPAIRADFGPVLLGAMLGGELEFGADTSWTHAFIDDEWANAPDWTLPEDNHWWSLLQELTARVAEDASGRYLACTPDLGGSADVLLNLRGSSQLCMDVMLDPDRVRSAIDAIYPAWRKAIAGLYRIALERGAGLVHWLGVWSNRPYFVPACDFNYLIGPEQFNSVCLPDIARQAATMGRGAFHLDGPGATNHIDALLEIPEIQVIQFTPGTGTPSTRPWIDMFRKIQDRGRSLYIICPAKEVLELAETLRPEGLGLWVTDAGSPQDLDDLFRVFCKPFGG